MTIDIQNEKMLTLAEAAKLVPRTRGRKVHCQTIRRWITDGKLGIHLEGLRTGGTWLTSAEALQRFFEKLTAQALKKPVRPLSAEARDRADYEFLKSMGVR